MCIISEQETSPHRCPRLRFNIAYDWHNIWVLFQTDPCGVEYNIFMQQKEEYFLKLEWNF
jgi:hypothetical protein